MRACPMLPSLSCLRLRKTSRKCAATYLATSEPPWPSKTPKRAMLS